jgi:signal transduction histidine kinase
VVTAVTVAVLLAVAGLLANRSVAPTAATALLIAGCAILIVVSVVAARGLIRADEGLRVGERALEAVPHAIFVVDALQPGRPNRYVNPAYAALTGYGVAEALGDGFDALAIFADPAQAAALEGELAMNTTSRITLRRRGGTLAAAKLELRAVPRSHGGRYIVGLLEEIKGGERSVDRLPRPRLEAGAASTATAGRAKDAFLSTLSHDLRSPLNACVMWLDVLALAPQPDKVTQAVEAIRRNLGRQTRLVNDLNDAAKISSGGLEVQLEPLDLVALLKRHIDAWQLLAIGKQLTFQHGIEPASAYVDADPERLSQALNHLVENAVASTPTGGRVELRLRSTQDAHIVEIEDTGAALSAEDAANLGTPLWRAPADAKGRAGLGLGLAVAHHLAAQHRGTLTAASRRAGALFTLTLPTAAGGGREQDALSTAYRTSSEL